MSMSTMGRSHRSGRSFDAAELTDRITRIRQQAWIVPPFYRLFWFLHNIALIITPVSFGMFVSQLYEGESLKLTIRVSVDRKA